MLLNRVETALMNNPIRAAIQRHFEAQRLLRMGGPSFARELGAAGFSATEELWGSFARFTAPKPAAA